MCSRSLAWVVTRFRYETSRMIRAWMANHDNAEEFALLKLRLYNQITTGAPNSLRHLRGSWHFRPITRLNKLHLFPGTFRRENGLLGYSIGAFLTISFLGSTTRQTWRLTFPYSFNSSLMVKLFHGQPKLLGRTLELWLADPTFSAYQDEGWRLHQPPHPWQGGFHDSGIRPVERQSMTENASLPQHGGEAECQTNFRSRTSSTIAAGNLGCGRKIDLVRRTSYRNHDYVAETPFEVQPPGRPVTR